MSNSTSIATLDARARDIFRQIVETYLSTGEPVGSRTLSKQRLNLSPASIRNVMADLAAAGLLNAPHISAGRIPTQQGLRLFVDSFLEVGNLSETERKDIENRIAGSGNTLENALSEASEMLSGLAGGASIIATPRRDSALKHIELVALGQNQALVVMVSADGDVENRVISIPTGTPAGALIEATNFLNARLRGRTLAQASESVLEELRNDRAALDEAAARLIEGGIAEWSGEDPERGRALIVRGRANLLTDAQATADLERVRKLFDDLENKKELIQVLDLVKDAEAVRIFIGSENPLFSLSGSSLIIAPYMNAERKVAGALGVIGPTRLNYARVIPVVDYTARVVGRLLDDRARRGGEGR
ncbi:MAG: heat-inducible transcriptional repressor HrcA [Caulobacterales bacterium]